ncbi:MAG: trypsin-like peptidase domain-containing protein [Steroidobacteraceae bacterium]|jgi:serine protease Do
MPTMQSYRPLRSACLFAVALVGCWAGAAGAAAPSGYAALVRRIAPSVVTVLVVEEHIGAAERAAQRAERRAAADTDPNAMDAIIRRLLSTPGGDAGRDDGPSRALGSGFVVREDGMIVTNRHVIVGARTVRVRLSDGRELAAKVVGADAVTDIALLSIEAGRLPALHLGSSDAVSVGDAVIAIGNPFGLGQSVSAGIVSARARTLEDDPYIDFLQTDASINRGNSGGPLLSADGTVVGVTSAIFSPNGGSVGLGFAIPAETVTAIVRELEAHGRVERGYLGISAQTVTPILATALHMKAPAGALVTALDAQGPALGALVVGDVLLSIGAEHVTFKDLSKITARLVPGSLVTLTILRAGAEQSVALKIGRLPDPPADPGMTGGLDTWVPALGVGVAETTAEIRKAIKATDEPAGLIITQLRPSGPGALAGLRVGDLITHVATTQLVEPSDLATTGKPTPQDPVLLRVVRDGLGSFVALTGEAEP